MIGNGGRVPSRSSRRQRDPKGIAQRGGAVDHQGPTAAPLPPRAWGPNAGPGAESIEARTPTAMRRRMASTKRGRRAAGRAIPGGAVAAVVAGAVAAVVAGAVVAVAGGAVAGAAAGGARDV